MNIFFFHEGKANYPELVAYQKYFENHGVNTASGTANDYEKISNKEDWIVWQIMGFYPSRPSCKKLIHDYRSLSVGKFCALKDKLKCLLNATPDLRIFQNAQIETQMGFSDSIESIKVPMGVPDNIFNITTSLTTSSGRPFTFVYIGEMSRERKFELLLDAFAKRLPEMEGTLGKVEFLLVGSPDKSILDEYSHSISLNFVGKVTQKEALQHVANSDVAICFFPYHRPHKYQTPTKLLEYAALGVPIVCNDAPMNIQTAEELELECLFGSANIFEGLDLVKLGNMRHCDGARLRMAITWDAIFKRLNLINVISALEH